MGGELVIPYDRVAPICGEYHGDNQGLSAQAPELWST